mmetsp:Transcript_1047/g.2758  ORF Transcript_1047/g.2758 Transcript_1047/m.2758 type:complete len:297 (+) Transcript_1047:2737-3627(+)
MLFSPRSVGLVASAQIGFDDLLVALHLGRRALGDLLAVVQHRHAVAQAHHQLHVMLDQQDGAAVLADAVDQLAQHDLFGRIHAGGGLIERDQLGVGGQGPGDLQAALVAVAQSPRLEFGVLADADVVQQLLGTRLDGSLLGLERRRAQHGAEQTGTGADVAADHHVLQRRHLGEEADVLEGARDAGLGDLVHRLRRVGRAAEREAAAVRHIKPGDHVEEGGLASAVGADQAVDLARADLDADVGQGLHAAEALGRAADVQNDVVLGAHGVPPLTSRPRVRPCHARAPATGRAGAPA